MDNFKDQAKNVTSHIKSDHEMEMSKRSIVVRFKAVCIVLSCTFYYCRCHLV